MSSDAAEVPLTRTPQQKSPSEFLRGVLGRSVIVKLHSGVDYRGVLACLDGHMNIAMEQTEEYIDGQLKAQYGDAFIRGNNGKILSCYNLILIVLILVLYISTKKKRVV
jgi:U6 snRNA-associated Sm-like protein LSm6